MDVLTTAVWATLMFGGILFSLVGWLVHFEDINPKDIFVRKYFDYWLLTTIVLTTLTLMYRTDNTRWSPYLSDIIIYIIIGLSYFTYEWIQLHKFVTRQLIEFQHEFDTWWEINRNELYRPRRYYLVDRWNDFVEGTVLLPVALSRRYQNLLLYHDFIPSYSQFKVQIVVWIFAWPGIIVRKPLTYIPKLYGRIVTVMHKRTLAKDIQEFQSFLDRK